MSGWRSLGHNQPFLVLIRQPEAQLPIDGGPVARVRLVQELGNSSHLVDEGGDLLAGEAPVATWSSSISRRERFCGDLSDPACHDSRVGSGLQCRAVGLELGFTLARLGHDALLAGGGLRVRVAAAHAVCGMVARSARSAAAVCKALTASKSVELPRRTLNPTPDGCSLTPPSL
jgi:hypothetical protein